MGQLVPDEPTTFLMNTTYSYEPEHLSISAQMLMTPSQLYLFSGQLLTIIIGVLDLLNMELTNLNFNETSNPMLYQYATVIVNIVRSTDNICETIICCEKLSHNYPLKSFQTFSIPKF